MTAKLVMNTPTVSIPVFDLIPNSRITPQYSFHLTYLCIFLELFPRGQSMQVHDLAKDEWSLITKWKWVESIDKGLIYND